ncbi:VF530 family protein [Flavobacterium filum]|uniref:VF530 family protein n=1 Tax=Flavobacterium filum TaxID=370974 RepID=UPI000407663E|nr:VF530 family protein [Flavobacterium filum]
MQHNDPLHGKTLQSILDYLVEFYGFETLSQKIKIRCFTENPSIKSSLTFLRKTDWARKKVEELYCETISKKK